MKLTLSSRQETPYIRVSILYDNTLFFLKITYLFCDWKMSLTYTLASNKQFFKRKYIIKYIKLTLLSKKET